jgi:quercetin dioxygenase-like cupin family protein
MVTKKRITLVAGLAAALALVAAPTVLPALAQPPIAIELLTPRSEIPDAVSGQVKVKLDGRATNVINMKDLARTAVARITVQPNAMFPWHTHAGPVVVNIAQGELVYVSADDCVLRPYQAGKAFVDLGHGHVHSAFNRGSEPMVFYATFFQVAATGPLTLTEGIKTAIEEVHDSGVGQSSADHKRYIAVCIRDTGQGIPQDMQEHDPERPRAQAPGGNHVIELAELEKLSPRQAGDAGPTSQPNHGHRVPDGGKVVAVAHRVPASLHEMSWHSAT